MTTDTTKDDQTDGPVIADGVDDEPVEHNRRIFEGTSYYLIAGFSAISGGSPAIASSSSRRSAGTVLWHRPGP